MAKSKSKASTSIPHRHIHARVSYLYQAASYLANSADEKAKTQQILESHSKSIDDKPREAVAQTSLGQSQYLSSHIRGVVRKAQTRIRPEIKRTICKRCDCILIPGRTSTCFIENPSSGGRKPWADILVYRCNMCQATKRFPIGQSTHGKQAQRKADLAGEAPNGKAANGNDIGD